MKKKRKRARPNDKFRCLICDVEKQRGHYLKSKEGYEVKVCQAPRCYDFAVGKYLYDLVREVVPVLERGI